MYIHTLLHVHIVSIVTGAAYATCFFFLFVCFNDERLKLPRTLRCFFSLRKILHEGTNSKKGKGTASLKKKKIHVCIYISWKCGSPWQQCSAMFFFFFHLVYVSSSVGKTCHSYKKSFIRQFRVLSFCQILYC